MYKCDSKKMVNYDLLNYILINLYPFLTCFCQGTAYLCACLWHVTTYRFWNLLGGIIACLCLPVDILIFYVEPLGFVGTTASMVLGFIPFCIIIADAAFPIKSINVVANGKKIQVCIGEPIERSVSCFECQTVKPWFSWSNCSSTCYETLDEISTKSRSSCSYNSINDQSICQTETQPCSETLCSPEI